jgi:uncharacterized repeat protein (TIGR01451 family)
MGFVISMKFFSKFQMLAMLAVALMAIGTRAGAQVTNKFAYSGLGSPNPVGVNSNLTYTINWTNYSSGVLPFISVTNMLDAHSTFIGATIITNTLSLLPTTATNGNVVVFTFNTVGSNGFAQMSIIVKPTAAGLITNAVTYNVANATNFFATIINQVTNAVTPTQQADLAVAMTGPPSQVFTNDWMTYGVNVTNLGPAFASNVMLTNTLPPGVGYLSVSPPSPAPTLVGSNLIFNLGTLASNAFMNFQLTVQPTNAGTGTFVSVVNSTSVTDPNPANNTATTNITVGTFIYGQLIATNFSAMNYDPQIGLMTNTIRLTNIGTNVVAAARVIVSGLTNWLYNAVGTNSGNPYVVYNAQLTNNQTADLLLEFFVPTRLPITVTNYTAVITLIASNNIQPVLPVIPTQTVNELALLTVTNTATEPDPHATTLGYGLVNPLTGMAIDTNGIITWTPAQNQSPSTNTITTVVTNSDPSDLVNPQLTATNSFTVIVREVNTAPILPAIPTQTVNEQTLLTVTNTATNSNIHATNLGYSLVNPPVGMSISNGIITWTPAHNQSPSTNTIITVVTNSDPFDLVNPQLTATNSFTVIVIRLVLTGPTRLANGDFQFIFSTGAGVNYTIQYSINLTDWISLFSFTSPGGSITVQDPNAATSPWRFYRVRLNP